MKSYRVRSKEIEIPESVLPKKAIEPTSKIEEQGGAIEANSSPSGLSSEADSSQSSVSESNEQIAVEAAASPQAEGVPTPTNPADKAAEQSNFEPVSGQPTLKLIQGES